LLADATALGGQTASAITKGLLQKVRAFAGNAPQSDDIAILALKVLGKENPPNLTPSPWGEGRGEGDRDFHQPAFHADTAAVGREIP